MELLQENKKEEENVAEELTEAPAVLQASPVRMIQFPLDSAVDNPFIEISANRTSMTPTTTLSNYVRLAPVSETEKRCEEQKSNAAEEEKASPRSPQRRKERMRKSVKQTFLIGQFKKSLSNIVNETWCGTLPTKIANSANSRVIEADMEGFADLENSFETKYELGEKIGEVSRNCNE